MGEGKNEDVGEETTTDVKARTKNGVDLGEAAVEEEGGEVIVAKDVLVISRPISIRQANTLHHPRHFIPWPMWWNNTRTTNSRRKTKSTALSTRPITTGSRVQCRTSTHDFSQERWGQTPVQALACNGPAWICQATITDINSQGLDMVGTTKEMLGVMTKTTVISHIGLRVSSSIHPKTILILVVEVDISEMGCTCACIF
jgi:hypothetical protein